MPSSQPGFFVRLMRGIWNTLNFTRSLILNVILVIVLCLLFGAFFRSTPIIGQHTALVLDPQGSIVEQYSTDASARAIARFSGDTAKEVQLRDVLQAINAAATDSRIDRIVLVPDQMTAGISTLREIGQALDRFRATKKDVVVVSEGMDQGQYYLAAHANQILLDPQGSVLLEGLANYRSYYRDALDKLGVEVHLIRVGQYKSAGEPYILNHASDAAKEADLFWMAGIWTEFLDEIAAMRKVDAAGLSDDIAHVDTLVEKFNGDLAKLALDRHLVDKLATRTEARKLLSDLGLPDDSGETFRQINWSNYLGMQLAENMANPLAQVAIVVAQGEIV
ncbi:MAG: S49 family peptidase, partial [Dokdonella sp.]